MLKFGEGAASYEAAGSSEGIAKLVRDFYDAMSTLPQAATIRAMHAASLNESIAKLTVFLTTWLGGPRSYSTEYGPIQIPKAHKHLAIGLAEKEAWMDCMREAVAMSAWNDEFRSYFLEQIEIPARRVQEVASRKGASSRLL